MGQALSCGAGIGHGVFRAVRCGDLETISAVLERDPTRLFKTTVYDGHSVVHIAAANGQIEILSVLLERDANPDVLNRHKQTPLMLAAMHGRASCVKKLIEAGADILMFDNCGGRTCLHYAAYYGHSECVQAIISAARSSPVAVSWGFARYVNTRDGKGATALHLAARQRRSECVHILLENGALPCASSGGYGSHGSTPLHLAARGGSIDCVRELLAWGADRLQRDASGRIAFLVALRHKHRACAALLNPSSLEPLVWPSTLKFISELNKEVKELLEHALLEANIERERRILKGTPYSIPSPLHSNVHSDDDDSEAGDMELCCICFEQACTIEVQDCGHQMCAQCMLALCSINKPNPTSTTVVSPGCPFCRSTISGLAVVRDKTCGNTDCGTSEHSPLKMKKPRRLQNFSEGSSSFKSFGSLGKMGGHSSGSISVDNELIDKS